MNRALQVSLAIIIGQLIASMVRLFGLGAGSTLPGRLARKLRPTILTELSKQVTQDVVAVTGTNGKTTTCGLLAALLSQNKQRVAHNQLGANMLAGITHALVQQSHWNGQLKADWAVLEVDEASLRGVSAEVAIDRLVVTNLFRDQLDRYGELDTTGKMIQAAFPRVAKRIWLNADDPLVAALGREQAGREQPNVLYFGLEGIPTDLHPTTDLPALHDAHAETTVPFPREVTDCPRCGHPLAYSRVIYGHLGHYHCPACKYRRPTPTLSAWVTEMTPQGALLRVQYQAPQQDSIQTLSLYLPLPGLFNVYNLLAALTVPLETSTLNSNTEQALTTEAVQTTLEQYHGVFGRAERRTLRGKPALVLLIKNPVGASEVLSLVARDPNARLLIAINDDYADGRDISWLWDATFEKIPTHKPVMVSGRRAEDMAVRMRYAGFPHEQIVCEPNLSQAIEGSLRQTQPGETLYILPTYTVLLTLRKTLSQFEGPY
ncbi:MAG: Mur ligase family protein [Candidatus Melainabacteria bacterium]|nr:Mur ligase family protein [Candidatus Melainabacteria bacterium]